MAKHRVLRAKDAPVDAPPLACVLVQDVNETKATKDKDGKPTKTTVCVAKAPAPDVADAIIANAQAAAIRHAQQAGLPVPEFVDYVEIDGEAEVSAAVVAGVSK